MRFLSLFSLLCLFALLALYCKSEKTCKYKPAPIFEKNLPHVQQYNFEKQGQQSLESILLDNGVLLEVEQDVCEQSVQEYRFKVMGDYSQFADSMWIKESVRQLVYLSTLSPKQMPLKAWADIIELRRNEMRLGEDREVQPGIFVRIDRVLSPDQSTLRLIFSQQ